MAQISPETIDTQGRNNDFLTQELENGPLEKRSCRDLLCTLLWIASVIALIVIFSIGVDQGHPDKLAQPYDLDSNQCGESGTGINYFFYFGKRMRGLQIFILYDSLLWLFYSYYLCKACQHYFFSYKKFLKCPNWQQNELALTYLDCKATESQTECIQVSPLNVDLNQYTSPTEVISFNWEKSLKNFTIQIKICIVFDRVCVPAFITNLENTQVTSALSNAFDTLSKWISDVKISWKIILASLGMSFILGFIYLAIIKYIAGIIVWIIILLYFIILGLLGFFFYYNATQQEDEAGQQEVNQDSIDTNKGIAYAFWSVAFFSLLILCCFYHKIRLAIAIVKTASCYVRDVKASIFVPVVNIIIIGIFWAIWLVGLVYIYSVGDFEKSDTTSFSTVKWNDNTRYMVIYYLFGGIWKNAFILSCCQFILASSVCIWYFSQGSGGGCHKPISRSIYRLFRYHLGSIAFGSLILAIVQFIRFCLIYVQVTLIIFIIIVKQFCEKNKLTENKLIKFIIWCSQCCLAYLERFIKFLNRNAYIQIALSGKSFCGAAKDAFCLIIQQSGRFAVVLSIGSIFVFFGKFFICLLGTLFGYLIIEYHEEYKDKLYSVFLPTFVMFILNYTVGCLFMSVYSMAIDAILHCFILDEELSKKYASGQARHSPEYLEEFIDKLEVKK